MRVCSCVLSDHPPGWILTCFTRTEMSAEFADTVKGMILIAIISLSVFLSFDFKYVLFFVVVFRRYCTALPNRLSGIFTIVGLNLATFSVSFVFFQVIFADLYMFNTKEH